MKPQLPGIDDLNLYMAEGLEAKELLKQRSVEKHRCDSLANLLKAKLTEQKDQNDALKENNGILTQQNGSLVKSNAKLTTDVTDAKAGEKKAKDRKKFWRNFAIGEGMIIVVTVAVVILVFL